MNSAIAVLPLELWTKILTYVVGPLADIDEEFKDWPTYYSQSTPLNLAIVCRGWRELVHACPDMWTSLVYSISEHSITRGGLVGVQAWLARSGTRPLSLEFTCFCRELEILNAFLEVFYLHFPRLAVLRVGMGGGIWGEILPTPRVDMPLCWLVNTDFSNEKYVAWFAPFFRNELPALRALKMREYLASTVSRMPVEHHMSGLTHLNAVANNFKMRPVDILRGCPRLVACRLYLQFSHNDNSNGWSDDTACEPFTLVHLRTLWLHAKASSDWRDVFAHTTFPALEEITLIGSMWPVPTFAPFLERSCCPLRHLSLPECNASAAEVITVLGAVTETLETFCFIRSRSYNAITDSDFNDTLLDALDPLQRDVLVPRLHSLEMIKQGALETTEKKLFDVVRARMTSNRTVPLQRVEFQCTLIGSDETSFSKRNLDILVMLRQQYPGLTVNGYPDAVSIGSGADCEVFLKKILGALCDLFLCRYRCIE